MAQEVTGIFVDNPADVQPKDSNPNTPEQQKLVDMVNGDYTVFKAQRQDIEDTWRTEDRFYEGGKKQWQGLRSEATMKTRPNSTDNIAFSQIEGIVSALTGWTPIGKFEATEPNDEQKAHEITQYMPFEMRQIKFKAKYVKAVRRFIISGLLLFKNIHDPTIEGGRGNNRFTGQNDIIPLDYGSFFPDPRIGDLLYIQKSKAMIINQRKDIEYFKERWDKQGAKVQPDNYSSDVQIYEQDRQGSESTFNTTDGGTTNQTTKQQTAGLIEYWYKGVPKTMTTEDKQSFKDLAARQLSEGKDPTEALAKEEGKAKGIHCIYISSSGVFLEHISYVYDHGQYPITVRCLFPVEGSIWPKGYMRDLISPQIMLNKFSELAVEQTAKMGNGAIIYEEGSIAESKIPIWKRIRSQVGAMLPVLRKDGVQELEGKGPPAMIMNFIQHWLTILQKIPRRFDNANGGVSFQGESGKHAEQLQAAAQGNLSTPTELIEDGLAESFEQYIELIAQFYTQERIGRVLGKGVKMGSGSIKSAAPPEPYDTGNQIPHPETGQMVPDVRQVQEEYTPGFDITVSIGVEKPQDREYWVQTATTLFQTIDPMTQMPVIDAKALIYTVDNGRMEPFEVIEERMGSEQQIMQKIQELEQKTQQDEQEIAILTKQVEMLHGNLDDSQQQNTQGTADTLKQLNEGQRMDHEQQMQMQQQDQKHQIEKANTLINAAKVVQMGQKQAVTSNGK